MARWTDVLSSNLWSEGHLFNQKAVTVFKRCDLGEFREYPAIVRDHTGSAHPLTYLHIRNVIPPTAIDFGRSEFYIAEMLGIPNGPAAVNSFRRLAGEATAGRCGRVGRMRTVQQDRLQAAVLPTGARLVGRLFHAGAAGDYGLHLQTPQRGDREFQHHGLGDQAEQEAVC